MASTTADEGRERAGDAAGPTFSQGVLSAADGAFAAGDGVIAETALDPGDGIPALARVRRAAWQLRIALLVAIAAGLGAVLAATYTAFEELHPLPLAVGASLALLGLAIGLLHIRDITRERRHHALLEALVTTFASPRDIAGTARAAAALLVGGGVADACLVTVSQDGDDGEAALAPLAAVGYPPSWLEGAASRLPAVPAAPLPATREEAALSGPWVAPLEPTLGSAPWVARVPIARGDAVLGLGLLLSRRRGMLGDAQLLATIGTQLAAALDLASLYEAAYERATALEEQDARRREFLYAIAHELRSPLTSIQTFAELLAREQQTFDGSSELLLSSLTRGVDRLGEFVEDLLALGRVEETEVRLELRQLDAAATLRAAEEMLRPAFMEREQRLTLDLPEAPLEVHADRRALEQVLINVLSNANRFTPTAGAVVVSARREGERVRIEVEDSGPGIATEDRAEIFLPFFRVQRDRAAQVPGSGLGLAVAKRLIELQGGTIWVEAATDEGATTGSRFCVELGGLEPQPAADEAAPRASEQAEQPEQTARTGQSTPSGPSGR